MDESTSPRSYNTVIFGASYVGIGIASQAPKDCLVLEGSCLIGKEFSASFIQKKPKVIACQSEYGKEFAASLKSRGLLSSEGELYAAPCAFVMSDFIIKHKLDIMLSVTVTEISYINGVYLISLIENGRPSTVQAKRVIDTTSLGMLSGNKREKSILCAVNGEGDYLNSITGISYIKVPLSPDCNWVAARNAVLEELELRGLQALMLAGEFAYEEGERRIREKGIIWFPCDGYYNLVEAFDWGCSYEA